MTDYAVQLPDGRSVSVQAGSPEEAAQGARNYLAREKGSQPQGKSDATANAFGQGATLGFGDELAAAVRAVLPEFSNFMMKGPALQREGDQPRNQTVSDAPTVGGRYEEELNRQRAQTASDAKAYPNLTTGANIAGNVATAALALPAGATSIGPSLMGNIAKGAAVGGGLGAVQGFGEGEGGAASRATNAATGAVYGAAGGAAVPVVGKGLNAAADTQLGRAVQQNVLGPALTWTGERLGGQIPVRSLSAAAPDSGPLPESLGQSLVNKGQSFAQPARLAATEDFASTLQKSNLSPEQIAAELDRLGPEGLFVDVNRQLMRKGRGLATLTGQTGDLSQSVLGARAEGRPDRMIAAFEGGEAPPATRAMERGFEANTRAVGNQAYQGDMVGAGLKQSPELMALYENLYVNKAIDEVLSVEKNARIGRPDAPPASPVEIMHKVKQKIWDMGFDKDTARPGATASYYRDLGTEFVDTLKRSNPALAEADRAYSQAKSLPEFFERGRNFLAGGTGDKAVDASAAGLADMLTNANVQQATAARAGSTTAARDLMTGMGAQSQTNRIVRGINQGTDVKARLGQLYEPEQAGNIINRAGVEQRFMDTEKGFSGQSNSIDKAVEAADAGNATLRVGTSGVSGYLKERLGDFLANHFGPSQALRDEYGRMLFATDPKTRKDILKLADELLRQRAAGSTASAATGAALGEQLAR